MAKSLWLETADRQLINLAFVTRFFIDGDGCLIADSADGLLSVVVDREPTDASERIGVDQLLDKIADRLDAISVGKP
jgi:hypothetical protein